MACRSGFILSFIVAILTALPGAPPANAQADGEVSGIWLTQAGPIIGLPLFSGMRSTGPNKWSGQIYNADDGNTYASNISVAGPDTLKVEGCVGALCGGESWSRSSR
jgi:uncharacterized protein (DUF2147 family)